MHADATDPPPSPIFSPYCAQGENMGRGEKSGWMLSFTRIKTGDKENAIPEFHPRTHPFRGLWAKISYKFRSKQTVRIQVCIQKPCVFFCFSFPPSSLKLKGVYVYGCATPPPWSFYPSAFSFMRPQALPMKRTYVERRCNKSEKKPSAHSVYVQKYGTWQEGFAP